jgi:deazaflavin-dependent oxidoreductase (nitroreductase family)
MPPEPSGAGQTLYERIATPLVASRGGSWFYVNVAPYLDRGLLRLTKGRWTTAGRGRVGFLKVRGARSGAERITPLLWTRDGDNVVLVASRGGDVKHPAWYRNVVANPDVRFSLDGVERTYRARTATAEERPRLWEMVNRRYAGYAVYQRRAGAREIPIVVLESSPSASS